MKSCVPLLLALGLLDRVGAATPAEAELREEVGRLRARVGELERHGGRRLRFGYNEAELADWCWDNGFVAVPTAAPTNTPEPTYCVPYESGGPECGAPGLDNCSPPYVCVPLNENARDLCGN